MSDKLSFDEGDIDRFSSAMDRHWREGDLAKSSEVTAALDGVNRFVRFLRGEPDFYYEVYSRQAFGESSNIAEQEQVDDSDKSDDMELVSSTEEGED